MKIRAPQLATPLLAVLLLTAMGAEQQTLYVPPVDVAQRYQRVEAALAGIPQQFDGWVSVPAALDDAAVTPVPAPEHGFCRRYVHLATGREALLALTWRRDARDLADDYSLPWYESNGWVLHDAGPKDLNVAGLAISARSYALLRVGGPGMGHRRVYNFLVSADGVAPDIHRLAATASHHVRRLLGAAQIHIALEGELAPVEQALTVDQLLHAVAPFLRTVVKEGD